MGIKKNKVMHVDFKTSPDFTCNMIIIQLLSKHTCTSTLNTVHSFGPPAHPSPVSGKNKTNTEEEREGEGRVI